MKDIKGLSTSEQYISFDDFREWLDKYDFVRNMIAEALMP